MAGAVYIPSRKLPKECLHSVGSNQGWALWKFSLKNAVHKGGELLSLLLQGIAMLFVD